MNGWRCTIAACAAVDDGMLTRRRAARRRAPLGKA
jgi:hypothetical protein